MLFKMLLLGVAIWLILTLLKQYRQGIDQPRNAPEPDQKMVKCAACDVHLPKSESVEVDGKHYCCAEHSQQDRS